MKVSELASRYAKATYELAIENQNDEKVFNDLRALDEMFARDNDVFQFLCSPLVAPESRAQALTKALANSGVSKEVEQLLQLLAKKGRFPVFSEIAQSFQNQMDASHGVCRGNVRSATTLAPSERQQIEAIVEKVLKKKVIMTYKVDPSVIGGLVAQVGSYTFDDSIQAHLKRMNEDLKRRTV